MRIYKSPLRVRGELSQLQDTRCVAVQKRFFACASKQWTQKVRHDCTHCEHGTGATDQKSGQMKRYLDISCQWNITQAERCSWRLRRGSYAYPIFRLHLICLNVIFTCGDRIRPTAYSHLNLGWAKAYDPTSCSGSAPGHSEIPAYRRHSH
jgi:hypothetical protein